MTRLSTPIPIPRHALNLSALAESQAGRGRPVFDTYDSDGSPERSGFLVDNPHPKAGTSPLYPARVLNPDRDATEHETAGEYRARLLAWASDVLLSESQHLTPEQLERIGLLLFDLRPISIGDEEKAN